MKLFIQLFIEVNLFCCASTDMFVVQFCVKHFEIALATVAGSGSCVCVCVRRRGSDNMEESGSCECVWIHRRPLPPPALLLPHRRPGELLFSQVSFPHAGERLTDTKLSCPQLQDDGGQDKEEGVPAQGDCEASPHHELRQTPTCQKHWTISM